MFKPVRFISEPIEVSYDKPPLLEKVPNPPGGFTWRGKTFKVIETLNEWVDFQRRGRMARNMIPTHAQTAERRGSWGVGIYYFRVRTQDGRVFDLYYDRAPKGTDERKGAWFIFQELTPESEYGGNNDNTHR
jgi:hypothetical protein